MEAFICDPVRMPTDGYGGALSQVRTDDKAAYSIRAIVGHNSSVDWVMLDEFVPGCANQAGEDNRNVVRMADPFAGLPV